MSGLHVAPETKKIVKTIAENPGISVYKLADKAKLHRVTVARALKGKNFTCQQGLIKDGFVKIVPGKRKADKCYLTFKGLLYALNLTVIKPADAAKVRQAHMIEPPPMPGPELAKICSWALPPPAFIEAAIAELKDRLPEKEVFETIQKLASETAEKIQFILAKHDRRESLLIQFLERQYSEQIYETLLRFVNILFYEPIIAGYYYHNLILCVLDKFFIDLFVHKNKEAVKVCIDILKKDNVTFEILQKAWLPLYMNFPKTPENLRKIFYSLTNASQEEVCKLLEQNLLHSTSRNRQ